LVPVELAVSRGMRFPRNARAASSSYEDVRMTRWLRPGEPRQITWTVDFPPEQIVIDPDVLVLQRNRDRAEAPLELRR